MAVDNIGPYWRHRTITVMFLKQLIARWTEAYAVPNLTAETVANKLLDEFFLGFLLPEQIHSDHSSQFESKLFQELADQENQNNTLSPTIQWGCGAVKPHIIINACNSTRGYPMGLGGSTEEGMLCL